VSAPLSIPLPLEGRTQAIARVSRLLVLAALIVAVLAPTMPLYRDIFGGDTGVFLYVGQQILEGKIPYRDIWDHKAPLIYYINALALLLGGGSIWGLWCVEVMSLAAAAAVGFRLLKLAFGDLAAFFASVVWVASLALILIGGNYTEEFALPWQFLALYCCWRSERAAHPLWWKLLLGGTAAVAILLRPNLAGVQVSIGVVLALRAVRARQWRRLAGDLAAIAVGLLAVLAPVVAFFWAHGALSDMLDQAVHYSAVYSATTNLNRARALLVGLGVLSASGISIIALFAWLGEAMVFWRGSDGRWPKNILVAVALIDVPIEFVLSTLSGRVYGHYYVAWLPAFAVLAAAFVSFFWHIRLPSAKTPQRALIVIGAALCVFPLLRVVSDANTPKDRANSRYQVAAFLSRHTHPADHILIWGAETAVHVVTQRDAPTRYVYQYPLFARGYQRAPMIDEFVRDISTNHPAYIVDTSTTNDLVPPLDRASRQRWSLSDPAYELLPETARVFGFIDAHYVRVGTVGNERWALYQYSGSQPAAVSCFACDLTGK
jgi:hypothetical protein